MVIPLSDPSLVLLIGPSGSGKSTFAGRHFRRTEVLSSDFCRALVCDDESNQAATDDAFELLHAILAKRMQRRRTTVIDATNVQTASRALLVAPARQHGISQVAIVFALPEEVCRIRNRERRNRQVPEAIIQEQRTTMIESIEHLQAEGFDSIFVLENVAEADTVMLRREVSHS